MEGDGEREWGVLCENARFRGVSHDEEKKKKYQKSIKKRRR